MSEMRPGNPEGFRDELMDLKNLCSEITAEGVQSIEQSAEYDSGGIMVGVNSELVEDADSSEHHSVIRLSRGDQMILIVGDGETVRLYGMGDDSLEKPEMRTLDSDSLKAALALAAKSGSHKERAFDHLYQKLGEEALYVSTDILEKRAVSLSATEMLEGGDRRVSRHVRISREEKTRLSAEVEYVEFSSDTLDHVLSVRLTSPAKKDGREVNEEESLTVFEDGSVEYTVAEKPIEVVEAPRITENRQANAEDIRRVTNALEWLKSNAPK